jgi:threonine/homoserine/homoserine lactone efflux protein
MLGQIVAFTAAATVVTISPGPDMALVARRAITDGWRRASVVSAGILTGLLVHATASAIGISAILVRSATAFTVLKIAGACYLVVLGILSFRSASRTAGGVGDPELPDGRRQPSGRKSFLQGFLNNVLNPKPALFYLAFVPQFVRPGDPVVTLIAILVAIHIAIGVVWLLVWSWLVSRASAVLTPRWRAALERVTGAVLVALGVRLAATSR